MLERKWKGKPPVPCPSMSHLGTVKMFRGTQHVLAASQTGPRQNTRAKKNRDKARYPLRPRGSTVLNT